jgi:hypothetical protein
VRGTFELDLPVVAVDPGATADCSDPKVTKRWDDA